MVGMGRMSRMGRMGRMCRMGTMGRIENYRKGRLEMISV